MLETRRISGVVGCRAMFVTGEDTVIVRMCCRGEVGEAEGGRVYIWTYLGQ
jgi:hypothetical protein